MQKTLVKILSISQCRKKPEGYHAFSPTGNTNIDFSRKIIDFFQKSLIVPKKELSARKTTFSQL